ncbi:hypothetical protein AUL38_16040 [Leucobacter sp. G161]|nr:hypothetical protein AUL38_16040 [Leucobacter sp. G161]
MVAVCGVAVMSAPFPELHPVGFRKRSAEHDGMSDVESWADPVELPVYAIAPPVQDDVTRPERTGFTHVLDLYMSSSPSGHRDVFVVHGGEYFAEGVPDDFNFGPFGFKPGVRVRLMRTEG